MQIVDDIPLELIVFELRYDHAFLMWDNVGAIWSSMVALNPSLRVSGIQPNQQIFESATLQMTLELTQIKVEARGSEALEELSKNAAKFVDLAASKLKLSSFSRAGLRMIRTKEFGSSSEALEFAGHGAHDDTCALSPFASKVAFGESSRFETERFGLQFALKVEEREFTFNVPWQASPYLPVPPSKKKWVVVADADYYTVGIIERESLDVETWVRQAWKTIRRQWSS
jgi:hypothetical protein